MLLNEKFIMLRMEDYIIAPTQLKWGEREYDIVTDETIVNWVNSVLWWRAKEVIFW